MNSDGIAGGALYYDARMNDARFCLENILSAKENGAVCLNYAEVLSLIKEKGRVCGALLRNHENGEEWTVQAGVIVNATGPWADNILELSRSGHKRQLRTTKGVHLISKGPSVGKGVLFTAKSDGRIIFVLPWEGNSLIGSTDTDYDGDPANACATREDVDYLLKEVNRLFPDAKLGLDDIITTFAGVRPLLNTLGGAASSLSREHLIHEDENGLISILGGKYTTFRLVAEQTMKKISRKLSFHPIKPCQTKRLPLRRNFPEFQDERLKERFCPHHEFIKADIIHAFQDEEAKTLSDFLSRRTTIIYSPCMGRDCIHEVSKTLKEFLDWDEDKLRRQSESYFRELELNQSFK